MIIKNKKIVYKKEVSKTYLKTVSAFANYNDGEIIFGITDDFNVVGIDNPIEACLNIENQINDSIKPKPDYSLKINDDKTISLYVMQGVNTSYRYNGKSYKRNDSSTIEVDTIEEKKIELIPFEAYREALANAIVHRTWDINANTKIEMYQDKIIISSPGGLDGDMTKEDYIKGNYSYLRNPIIANVFRRLNIIGSFATGIKRINEAYKNAYVKPTYNVTSSAISITLPVIEDYSLSLNEAKVIDSMKDNYLYNRADIEKLSGFTKDKLIRLLASLQEKGLIEKSGKGRATYYKKK